MWKIEATVTFVDMTQREMSAECKDRDAVEDFMWRCLDFPLTSSAAFKIVAPPFENQDDDI